MLEPKSMVMPWMVAARATAALAATPKKMLIMKVVPLKHIITQKELAMVKAL